MQIRPLPLPIGMLAVCLVVPVATAAPSLDVLASARASGNEVVASVMVTKRNATGLFARGYGRELALLASVRCSRGGATARRTTILLLVSPGRLYRLKMPFAGNCKVDAALSGSGRIRLQILG